MIRPMIRSGSTTRKRRPTRARLIGEELVFAICDMRLLQFRPDKGAAFTAHSADRCVVNLAEDALVKHLFSRAARDQTSALHREDQVKSCVQQHQIVRDREDGYPVLVP